MVDWSGRLGLDNKAPTPSVWILSTFGEEEGYSVRKCFRSRSCGDGRMQMEVYGTMPPSSGLHDFRCYSVSSASSQQTQMPKDVKFKKGKENGGSSSSSSAYSKNWSFNDPELQRKKRVASYKVYAVEGKMKGSFRKSFRWIKDRYTNMLYGWW